METDESPVIRKAIEIAGSQVLLAEKSGVSQAAISKLLRKESKSMSLRTARGISKATGIGLEEFESN